MVGDMGQELELMYKVLSIETDSVLGVSKASPTDIAPRVVATFQVATADGRKQQVRFLFPADEIDAVVSRLEAAAARALQMARSRQAGLS